MPYQLTDEAIEDLDEIQDFIARRSRNPQGADVVQQYLFDAFQRIGRDPARCGGKPWAHVTSLPVKFLTVRKYVVVYDDRIAPVSIIAIVGGRQDLQRLFGVGPRFRKLGNA